MINKKDDINKEKLHKTIIKLSKVHRRRAHEEFSKFGISEGQPKILSFLLNNDGCIQRELAVNCNIEPATVTSILVSMEKSELIYRVQSRKDRRVLHVFLTDKGKRAQKKVEKIFSLIDEECFDGFSLQERVETIIYLKRLYENIIRRERNNV